MNNILIITFIYFGIIGCSADYTPPSFRFSNFENTDVSELAMAVKNDDVKKIRTLLEENRINVNFKDAEYQMSLLALSIVNKKESAFKELLRHGADPNQILGGGYLTPLILAIQFQDNCDLFYIEYLLRYKADLNKKLVVGENYNTRSLPLLAAVGNSDENGEDCIETIKYLVDNGADTKGCFFDSASGICEGVIAKCITLSRLETLRYFVIDQKIQIPEKVYATGQVDPESMKVYSLAEILEENSPEYEDFIDEDGDLHDKSNLRELKSEIITYLNQN